LSRANLIQVYLDALPFVPVAVVQTAGGCRVAVGGEPAPGEKIEHRFYFKPLHIELLLGAAGLTDAPIDQPPDAVAALIEKTAKSMGAPYETGAELRAAAEKQVAEILERVNATNQAGGLRQLNRQYKLYRQGQIDKAERAIGYAAYIEQKYTIGIVRSIAATARSVI
jgi:hypothetical protein